MILFRAMVVAIVAAYPGTKGRPPAPDMGARERPGSMRRRRQNSRFVAACVRGSDLPPQERRLGPVRSIGRS